jgi:hypothetical protein
MLAMREKIGNPNRKTLFFYHVIHPEGLSLFLAPPPVVHSCQLLSETNFILNFRERETLLSSR